MAQFLESLEADLDRIAAVGDDSVAQAASRLSQAIRGSAGMRLLEALGEAAVEILAQLPEGHVEVRMSGQDPTFVFVEEQPQPAAPPAGDDEAPPASPCACPRDSRQASRPLPLAKGFPSTPGSCVHSRARYRHPSAAPVWGAV